MVLLVALLNGCLLFIDGILGNLMNVALYAESYMVSGAGSSMVTTLFEVVLGFGLSIIILMFLKKGFTMYVLWTDGDPDAEPTGLVLRFMQAMAVAICFPTVYDWIATVTLELSEELLDGITVATDYDWVAWVSGIASGGLLTAIFGLVFMICYFLLYFQFLMRGVELMVLRIGVPLACVGLLENDRGVFGHYNRMFFKAMVTTMIQICLLKLGLALVVNIDLLTGIGTLVMAIKTPSFVKEFVVETSGGVGLNTIYHGSRLVSMAKAIKK
ncbi:MAG: DUF6102 family protein [Eubacteriales bacterium]